MNAILTPVSFHNNTLFLVEHNGEPFTPMKPIVDGMGLDWKSQLVKLRANQQRWGMVEITIPSAGGHQSTLCMPLRKLPAYLASIYPNKVNPAIRPMVIAYQEECDNALWEYWDKGKAVNPRMAEPVPFEELDNFNDIMEKGPTVYPIIDQELIDVILYFVTVGMKKNLPEEIYPAIDANGINIAFEFDKFICRIQRLALWLAKIRFDHLVKGKQVCSLYNRNRNRKK